ncbi:granzyme K-like [Rhincodon typus]|uniref:granzyme K-like n=1 Tax=Rhincodon typus TaxID=259920 RepID=UPI0020304A10|nr:granzyme K-like [Rhincodon typus]
MFQVVFIASIINALANHGCVCVKIIGGRDVKRGSGSFMASIQCADEHVCGGTLIHAQWVLTSANCALCYFQKIKTTVVLGTHSLKDKKQAQTLNVIFAKPHPAYSKNTEQNNLALLKLDQAAKLNKFVRTLSLPRSTKDIKYGTKCDVLGWGQTDVDDDNSSDTLKEINLTVIKRQLCNSKIYYNLNPVITDDMLCAGDEKGRAKMCRGDAGGPLICKTLIKQFAGIAAFEKDCEAVNKPGIYMRLSKNYVKWIKETIKRQMGNNHVGVN